MNIGKGKKVTEDLKAKALNSRANNQKPTKRVNIKQDELLNNLLNLLTKREEERNNGK